MPITLVECRKTVRKTKATDLHLECSPLLSEAQTGSLQSPTQTPVETHNITALSNDLLGHAK